MMDKNEKFQEMASQIVCQANVIAENEVSGSLYEAVARLQANTQHLFDLVDERRPLPETTGSTDSNFWRDLDHNTLRLGDRVHVLTRGGPGTVHSFNITKVIVLIKDHLGEDDYIQVHPWDLVKK